MSVRPLYSLKRRVNPGRTALCAAAAALTGILGLGSAAPAELVNKIVATVDGEPVTLYEVNQFAERNIRARQLSETMDRPAMLDAVITEKIVQREVADKGVVVKDEEVDHYIEGIKQRNNINDQQLKEALAAQGLTLETYRTQIREDIQRQQLISHEIRGKVSITPEEVQRYYEAHRSEYSTPERLQVAHIVFRLPADAPPDQVAAVTAKASAVYDRLKGGADFAELAAQYSEDGTGKDGGALGWFKKGELLTELEKTASQLKVGEVSPPVRSKVGVHIIKLEGREDASSQNLDALQEQIKQQLYSQALEDRFQKWISEELRKKHHVELLQ
jgi:peptidyl-prolyl cis-trans isomerase SurA